MEVVCVPRTCWPCSFSLMHRSVFIFLVQRSGENVKGFVFEQPCFKYYVDSLKSLPSNCSRQVASNAISCMHWLLSCSMPHKPMRVVFMRKRCCVDFITLKNTRACHMPAIKLRFSEDCVFSAPCILLNGAVKLHIFEMWEFVFSSCVLARSSI